LSVFRFPPRPKYRYFTLKRIYAKNKIIHRLQQRWTPNARLRVVRGRSVSRAFQVR